MSQKRKSGLQRGLSEIVERQTAPVAEKSQLSRGLIDKFAEPKPTSMPSLTSQTSTTSQTRPAEPVAPQRDFQRVPNSITREAVPAGLFKGRSKQLYDCLYALTRGAVVPVRSVRMSRPKLMKKAGIGARVTFEAHVAHLQEVGLITIRQIVGEHEGNEYTVFLPEEVSMPSQTSQSSQTSMTSLTRQAQEVVGLVGLESSQTSHTLSVDSEATYGEPKTSFKTKDLNTDDEPLAELAAVFSQVSRELTGKGLSANERVKWRELGELLSCELRIAAARTGTVSSVPAFLTEHLRRRLWKKDKAQLEAESKEGAGKTEAEQEIDASKCLDCGGSGWYYPDGPERGVAKCRHAQLKPAK